MLSIVLLRVSKAAVAITPYSIMTIGLSPSFGATARRYYQERIWLQVLNTSSIRKPACRVYPDRWGGTVQDPKRIYRPYIMSSLMLREIFEYVKSNQHAQWQSICRFGVPDSSPMATQKLPLSHAPTWQYGSFDLSVCESFQLVFPACIVRSQSSHLITGGRDGTMIRLSLLLEGSFCAKSTVTSYGRWEVPAATEALSPHLSWKIWLAIKSLAPSVRFSCTYNGWL